MRASTVKEKFVYALQEPSGLDIASTDRQRVVIAAERHSRACLAAQSRHPSWPANSERMPVSGGAIEPTGGESRTAVAARQLPRGLQDAGAGINGLTRLDLGHRYSWRAGCPVPDPGPGFPAGRRTSQRRKARVPGGAARTGLYKPPGTRICLAAELCSGESPEGTDRDGY